MTPAPEAILIAGANGAGKTTFARQFLQFRLPTAGFLNADEIQREDPEFDHPVAAARELLRRLDALAGQGETFAVETTLSSRSYVGKLRNWIDLGYLTRLHFIELPSADFAVQRVATRVAAGGHSVPDADVRRRFERGVRLFPRSTNCWSIGGILGSAMNEVSDLATTTTSDLDDPELEIMLEAARRATWDALHGPRHLRAGRFHPNMEDGPRPDEVAHQADATDRVSRGG